MVEEMQQVGCAKCGSKAFGVTVHGTKPMISCAACLYVWDLSKGIPPAPAKTLADIVPKRPIQTEAETEPVIEGG